MSEENVERVRAALEVFSESGIRAVIDRGFMAPDVVIDATQAGIPGVGVFRGLDEIAAFFEEDWFGTFPLEEWAIQVEELIDHGDQVIAVTNQQRRDTDAGIAAALKLTDIFTLREGLQVRVQLFRDREEALQAAGLRE